MLLPLNIHFPMLNVMFCMLQFENSDLGTLFITVLLLVTATFAAFVVMFSLLLFASNSFNISIKSKSGISSSSKLASKGIRALSALMFGAFSMAGVRGVTTYGLGEYCFEALPRLNKMHTPRILSRDNDFI